MRRTPCQALTPTTNGVENGKATAILNKSSRAHKVRKTVTTFNIPRGWQLAVYLGLQIRGHEMSRKLVGLKSWDEISGMTDDLRCVTFAPAHGPAGAGLAGFFFYPATESKCQINVSQDEQTC